MVSYICQTCGVGYPPSSQPPERCIICEDSRQYVGWNGQQWTTLEELQRTHVNLLEEQEPGVVSIRTEPAFAIGQRAFLVETSEGNILWDCITVLGDATVEQVRARGGVRAMAISHPHYYSTMADWSAAFGGVPIYIHEAEREWVVRKDHVRFWQGETHALFGGATLVRCGGHFTGYQVLHWNHAIFAGDQPQVAMDRRWVSFLYSYPNMIPLNARRVQAIVDALEPFEFDRQYGAFHGRTIWDGAKQAVRLSAERYLKAISDDDGLA